jgi:hypothetical protein
MLTGTGPSYGIAPWMACCVTGQLGRERPEPTTGPSSSYRCRHVASRPYFHTFLYFHVCMLLIINEMVEMASQGPLATR